LRGPLVARRTVSLFAAGRSKEARAFADNALRQSLPAEQEADVRLSLAAMFAISADDRADTARQGLSLTGLSADTRARLWTSLFHNLMVAGRLDEGLAIEPEVRTSVSASTDLAAQYFSRSAAQRWNTNLAASSLPCGCSRAWTPSSWPVSTIRGNA
jgi:hypothetical protein